MYTILFASDNEELPSTPDSFNERLLDLALFLDVKSEDRR